MPDVAESSVDENVEPSPCTECLMEEIIRLHVQLTKLIAELSSQIAWEPI